MTTAEAPVSRTTCQRIAQTCTYFNVRRATRILGEAFDRELRPLGLRGTQFSVLVATALLEQATVSRLAEVIHADRSTMTRALGPLERDGWIETRAGDDRRERLARLSPDGERRLGRAVVAWERAQRRVVDAMGVDAWTGLLAGARRVNEVRESLIAAGPEGADASDGTA